MGAAPTPSNLPRPMGGAMGALMSAGPIVEQGLRSLRDHPIATAAEATGVPSIMRGARDQDFGQLVRGALQAAPFMAGRGVGAVAAAAPEAAATSSADAEMLRNMLESGFAGGKTGAMVELPAAGAGRAGSTATAMAAARKMMSPQQIRSLVTDEIARRGGASSPEVEMAATEEVARRLASGWKPQGLMAAYQ